MPESIEDGFYQLDRTISPKMEKSCFFPVINFCASKNSVRAHFRSFVPVSGEMYCISGN